jgi:hypothetical protein
LPGKVIAAASAAPTHDEGCAASEGTNETTPEQAHGMQFYLASRRPYEFKVGGNGRRLGLSLIALRLSFKKNPQINGGDADLHIWTQLLVTALSRPD